MSKASGTSGGPGPATKEKGGRELPSTSATAASAYVFVEDGVAPGLAALAKEAAVVAFSDVVRLLPVSGEVALITHVRVTSPTSDAGKQLVSMRARALYSGRFMDLSSAAVTPMSASVDEADLGSAGVAGAGLRHVFRHEASHGVWDMLAPQAKQNFHAAYHKIPKAAVRKSTSFYATVNSAEGFAEALAAMAGPGGKRYSGPLREAVTDALRTIK